MAEIHISDVLRRARKSCNGTSRASAEGRAVLEHIERQAAEIKRLRDALAKAREGLSCGLWDYGPGQSEHDQCDALIGEIDDILGDQE